MPSLIGMTQQPSMSLTGEPEEQQPLTLGVPGTSTTPVMSTFKAPVAPQYPAQTRAFGDSAAMRQAIFDRTLEAARNMKPFENARHQLALSDVNYAGPERFSKRDRKMAQLEGRTLARRLVGTWVLKDINSGEELGRKKTTLANVPYVTDDGTFVDKGNEYSLSNQMRLMAGSFTRVKENGEIEAHINVLPGKGVGHRYFLDPKNNLFYFNRRQSRIPLMPVLRAFDVDDKELEKLWGPEIYAANKKEDNSRNIDRIYQRVVRKPDMSASRMQKLAEIRETLEQSQLDPAVTKRTLGEAYDHLSLPAILKTTRKILAVSRGEEEPDDRDRMPFQTVFGPEDLISERLAKDYGGAMRQLFNKVSWSGDINKISPGALTGQLRSALLSSGLGQPLEEVNSLDILDKQYRISRMGEGGIPSTDSIPDEARSVQDSHMNFIDPSRTPESLKAGVDLFLTSNVRKGRDGLVYAQFNDVRTGKPVWKTPQDIADEPVAFAGQLKSKSKTVLAVKDGRMQYVPRNEVQLEVPHNEHTFSPLANLIPGKSMSKAHRVAMGSRMMTQALPLVQPEAPLVQSGRPGGGSYEQYFGKNAGALYAQKQGTIQKVTDDDITIRYPDGTKEVLELYNNMPYNRKTRIHQTPSVQVGQTVQPGQLLATSNYTDSTGAIALGANFRVGYLPYKGKNYEDAIVVSESAAKRLTSEHVYQDRVEFESDWKRKKRDFTPLFGSKYTKEQLDMLDDNGMIKPGSRVKFGDPLVLAASPRGSGKHKILKKKSQSFRDDTLTWEHNSPGVVTDSVATEKGTSVVVKTERPLVQGDKLSGRYGGKGVVADVVPDSEMPRNRAGEPMEVLLNDSGIITRTNPSQAIEAWLGKVARKTGKPEILPDFGDIEDMRQYAFDKLRQHGLEGFEDLIDPETERKIPGVLTGERFIMKLHHMAEDKGSGRATGGYTGDEQPAKGGETGSKRIGLLETSALLAHGATGVLRDMSAIRGQRNEDYWLAFMQGVNPPKPKVPFVFQRFVNELKGAGINVVPQGGQLHIMAMTNKDVDELAGDREIKTGETVRLNRDDMEPITGGLFDPKLTGGHRGNRWSFVRLHEPMPNPVMEDPIRHMLDITEKKLRNVIAGKEELHGQTGPEAIRSALSNLDIKKALSQARQDIAGTRKGARDKAVRRLTYLKTADRLGIHPRDWILDKVPVLPPVFRPVSIIEEGKGVPLVADANYLYRELIDSNNLLKSLSGEVDDVSDERLSVYDNFKAVTGFGQPTHPELREKRIRGLIRKVLGNSPKSGTVQRRLLSKTVDLVGRAVIVPNPDLDMDSIGIPEDRAWEACKPFVVRRLRRRGMSFQESSEQFKNRGKEAREELLNEMKVRPVIASRAPVMHKFGIMSFWPRLTKGSTLQVSPLIVKGFNADFDGDQMNYHVPVDEDARKNAIELMLPSKNLFSPADFKSVVHLPSQEYVGGLYAATAPSAKMPLRIFKSKRDMIRAYLLGEITANTPVEIPNEQ